MSAKNFASQAQLINLLYLLVKFCKHEYVPELEVLLMGPDVSSFGQYRHVVSAGVAGPGG